MPSFPPSVPPSQSAHHVAGHGRAMETVLGSVPGTVERGHTKRPHCPCDSVAGHPQVSGHRGLMLSQCSWYGCQSCCGGFLHPTTKMSRPTTRSNHGVGPRPGWHELRVGRCPLVPSEPGEWQHGWQYHGSSTISGTVVFPVVPRKTGSLVLHGVPTGLECKVDDFQRTSKNRGASAATCWTCLARAACPHSARSLMWEGRPERTLARVCREGGMVQCAKLRDMNVAVTATDQHHRGPGQRPINQRAQLVVNITV